MRIPSEREDRVDDKANVLSLGATPPIRKSAISPFPKRPAMKRARYAHRKLESFMKQQSAPDSWTRMPSGPLRAHLFVGQRIPLAGVVHQNGTILFGEDSQTSGLAANC